MAVLCTQESCRTVKLVHADKRPRLVFTPRPQRVLYYNHLDCELSRAFPECVAAMAFPSKSPPLSPDDRLQEITAVFARAVLRTRRADPASDQAPDDRTPETSPAGLEVSDAPWLSVVRGTTG